MKTLDTTALRAKFEKWMREDYFGGIADAGPWDDERNCYVEYPSHLAWKAYQAGDAELAERYLTVTTTEQGEVILVSWQDEDHRILEIVWEKK